MQSDPRGQFVAWHHLTGAYLAVCGTDRESDIGGEHNSECGSQLNSEPTAERHKPHGQSEIKNSVVPPRGGASESEGARSPGDNSTTGWSHRKQPHRWGKLQYHQQLVNCTGGAKSHARRERPHHGAEVHGQTGQVAVRGNRKQGQAAVTAISTVTAGAGLHACPAGFR